MEKTGGIWRISFGQNGILIPWKNAVHIVELQNIAIRPRIVSLLAYLSAMYEKGAGRGPGKEDVAQEILRYINEHLTERLTLEGLADKFYMSKNHLTAIFKRAAGDYSSTLYFI